MKSNDVVLVSTNRGKIVEIKDLLQTTNINLLSISQFTQQTAPEEQSTFVENALSKARFGAKMSNLPALADDSGIVVPALDGKPGVLSARYAQDGREQNREWNGKQNEGQDGKQNKEQNGQHNEKQNSNKAEEQSAANRHKLLTAMQGMAGNERKAFFVCVIVLLRHPLDPLPIIASGEWHGTIVMDSAAEKGNNGFGYDPLFYIPELNKTSAELQEEEKNSLSHRAKAMTQFKELISIDGSISKP